MKQFFKRKGKSSWGRETSQRLLFTKTLADLLENGFTLQEALGVIDRSQRIEQHLIKRFQHCLVTGASLAEGFRQLGFSPQEIAQIQLAEEHGNVCGTLRTIETHLTLWRKQQQAFRKVATYPLLLIVFVLTVLLSMRQFLLPQLLATEMVKADHPGILFLRVAPYSLGLLVLFLTIGLLYFQRQNRRRSALAKAVMWSRLPLVGTLYQLYMAAYFSLEWGKLFTQGVEIREIISLMRQTITDSLMNELAAELHQTLHHGLSLSEKLAEYPFLTREFSLIVFQGEAKGKLGEELLIYSELTRDLLLQRVERMLQWIQPIIFLIVALLIISVYGAMFLPIYSNMGGISG
ncbi:competence type IV pilus assembly protein ComGB [Enterococcus massiliensis]|uniref:competence type IV pilus assembly protein ComGB n=1 Tax=Enterococcus massiliensis TaxID=1640685 RepID=UPI00065E0B5D|nr:competence type IV pilus assembly protein ComGB [Enterococcus massiliensis]